MHIIIIFSGLIVWDITVKSYIFWCPKYWCIFNKIRRNCLFRREMCLKDVERVGHRTDPPTNSFSSWCWSTLSHNLSKIWKSCGIVYEWLLFWTFSNHGEINLHNTVIVDCRQVFKHSTFKCHIWCNWPKSLCMLMPKKMPTTASKEDIYGKESKPSKQPHNLFFEMMH